MIWRVILFWLLGSLLASGVGNQAATLGYDGGGSRLWKQGSPTNTLQVWIGGNYEEKDGKVLYHISAGDRMVYTYSSDGSVAEYYHPDHLHSAQVMSTTGGGLYQHYEYAAYGNSRYMSSATAFPASRRFTSQVLDEETGLYYFGARYYDPVIGRFIQPDTIIPNPYDPQAYDRYAYARDNPFEYVDPTGHAPEIFSTAYWKNLGHRIFIGNGPQLDPQSAQQLGNAEGIGPSPLTDENGNVISGGDATIKVGMAVVTAPLKTVVLLGGAAEDEQAAQAVEKEVPQIIKNAKQGRAFETQVGKELKATDDAVAEQVTLRTHGGNRTRADFLSKDKSTGTIKVTEAKSSETAPLTSRQTTTHPEIEEYGATVVGKGKPGYPPGTKIPPTKVNVVRPPQTPLPQSEPPSPSP